MLHGLSFFVLLSLTACTFTVAAFVVNSDAIEHRINDLLRPMNTARNHLTKDKHTVEEMTTTHAEKDGRIEILA